MLVWAVWQESKPNPALLAREGSPELKLPALPDETSTEDWIQQCSRPGPASQRRAHATRAATSSLPDSRSTTEASS